MRIRMAGLLLVGIVLLGLEACDSGRSGEMTTLEAEVSEEVTDISSDDITLPQYDATIRWTRYGIPRIKANDFPSLAYGYGYSIARDNICILADTYITVRAERSRYFGADNHYVFTGNGTTVNNLNSDFFFQRIIDSGVVEALLEQPPPTGPLPAIKEAVKGYVAGYNRYLRDVGIDNLGDATCRGAAWVKPIDEIDAYRRFYQLALLGSSGTSIDGIAEASPPPAILGGSLGDTLESMLDLLGPLADVVSALPDPQEIARQLGLAFDSLAIGSNAIALGSDATDNGYGMLLGNPHFPWTGSERFYEAQLTIPGKLNVAGASLFGVPLILIGHTASLAWSHTVSSAFRFTPFQIIVLPDNPTTYLVDGKPEKMIQREVSVQVTNEAGELEPRTRTMYETRYGPMVSSIMGLPLFPWTPVTAYTLRDANAANFRYVNHFFETNMAGSVDELLDILKRNQGVPWVNTIAADKAGNALYADITVVPNVPDSHALTCAAPLGLVTFPLIGLPVLDGSRSACDWQQDEDAVQSGTFGPANMPVLVRRDYVTNSNDSYWLSNPMAPLTGFARIIGDENTPRSLRTRSGLVQVAEQLENGGRFTRQALQDLLFNNRQYAAELWKDSLVTMCRTLPAGLGSSGPAELGQACDILATWNGRDDIDAVGALLFRRFVDHLLLLSLPSGSASSTDLFSLAFLVPYDPADPVNTPRGLNVLSPLVQAALVDAINDLNTNNIPLDAPLGEYQYEVRNGEPIPIHGGPGELGVFNAINVTWNPPEGYAGVGHGSSFIQVVAFNGSDCPDTRNILTYSQSSNPDSPHYQDQTQLYSVKGWVKEAFCEEQISADPELVVQRLQE